MHAIIARNNEKVMKHLHFNAKQSIQVTLLYPSFILYSQDYFDPCLKSFQIQTVHNAASLKVHLLTLSVPYQFHLSCLLKMTLKNAFHIVDFILF